MDNWKNLERNASGYANENLNANVREKKTS
jgi:hypothetical protein